MNYKDLYHGMLLDLEFTDCTFLHKFKVFAKRKSLTNPWTISGVEVEKKHLEQVIKDIQKNLKADAPYYAHFYNDKELIVIFKDKIFRVKPHLSTWKPIIRYGRKLKIPDEQLDFWPNRFQDEIHYFNP